MKKIKVGIIQQSNTADIRVNLMNLAKSIEACAAHGAQLIVLQELHNSLYFCQTENTNLFDLAEPIPGHKELKGKTAYDRYDNYDAIEVPFTDAIPSDYDGVMGVPISFLDKYCPEQFEILGITKTWYGSASKVYPEQIQVDRHGKETKVTKLNDGAVLLHSEVPQNETYYMVDGKYYTQVYARVLIKHIRS